jgi:hypothetical protein
VRKDIDRREHTHTHTHERIVQVPGDKGKERKKKIVYKSMLKNEKKKKMRR